MPLIKSPSKKAFSKNVEAEMSAGKPQKQSLAIAYSIKAQNKRKKMAYGGMADGGQTASRDEFPIKKENYKSMSKKKMAYGGKAEYDGEVEPKGLTKDNDQIRPNANDYESNEWAGGPDIKRYSNMISPSKDQYMSDKMAAGGEVCMHCAGSGKMHAPEDMHDDMMGEDAHSDEDSSDLISKIMHKRRMAEGGQVDLHEDDLEGPATNEEPNHEAMEFEAEHGMDDSGDQPMDSNEHGDDLHDEDEHDGDLVNKIRQKMKMKRG